MTKELIILISIKHYVCLAKLLVSLTFINRIIGKINNLNFLKQDKNISIYYKAVYIFISMCDCGIS